MEVYTVVLVNLKTKSFMHPAEHHMAKINTNNQISYDFNLKGRDRTPSCVCDSAAVAAAVRGEVAGILEKSHKVEKNSI